MTIQTTTIRNGVKVLAKETKYGINAVTYCNDTQAHKKQMQLKSAGVDCFVYQPPTNYAVRYIAIK